MKEQNQLSFDRSLSPDSWNAIVLPEELRHRQHELPYTSLLKDIGVERTSLRLTPQATIAQLCLGLSDSCHASARHSFVRDILRQLIVLSREVLKERGFAGRPHAPARQRSEARRTPGSGRKVCTTKIRQVMRLGSCYHRDPQQRRLR